MNHPFLEIELNKIELDGKHLLSADIIKYFSRLLATPIVDEVKIQLNIPAPSPSQPVITHTGAGLPLTLPLRPVAVTAMNSPALIETKIQAAEVVPALAGTVAMPPGQFEHKNESSIHRFCRILQSLFTPETPFNGENVKLLESKIRYACQVEKIDFDDAQELITLLVHYKKNNPLAALIFMYSQKTEKSGGTSAILKLLLESIGLKVGMIQPHRKTTNYELRAEEKKELSKNFQLVTDPTGFQKIVLNHEEKSAPITIFVTGHHASQGLSITGDYFMPDKDKIDWPVAAIATYISVMVPQIGMIQLCICYGQDVSNHFDAINLYKGLYCVNKPFVRLNFGLSLRQIKQILKENFCIMSQKPYENLAFEALDYYHGIIKNDEARKKLENLDNTYLLRYSSFEPGYHLLIKVNNEIRSMRLFRLNVKTLDELNAFIIKECPTAVPFKLAREALSAGFG